MSQAAILYLQQRITQIDPSLAMFASSFSVDFMNQVVQFVAAKSDIDGKTTLNDAAFSSFIYQPDFSIVDKGMLLEYLGFGQSHTELEKLMKERLTGMQREIDAFLGVKVPSPEELISAHVDHFVSAMQYTSTHLFEATAIAKNLIHKDAFDSYVFDRLEKKMGDLLSRGFPQFGAINPQAEVLAINMAIIGLAEAWGLLSSVSNVASIDIGLEFERECEALLQSADFMTRPTPATNDHGADIIAEKDSLKFAIQCKKYATPIGNAAVREVAAAKIHYECDYAVLCSDSMYTDSAYEAARKLGVILTTKDKLKDILQRI